MSENKLSCGHPVECQYFHPALRGGLRWRCIACDDPKGNTRAMQELKKKSYERPIDLPGRVCRVLEGITLLELKPQGEPLEDLVYRFTHIASCKCGNPHEDWLEEFYRTEEMIEDMAFTSPAEREKRGKWYAEGLRFECTGCGACCRIPGYVWVDDEAIDKLADEVGLPVEEFTAEYVKAIGRSKSLVSQENGACVFYDLETKRCKVYNSRPVQCRHWPFWRANVMTPLCWKSASKTCPGCDQGQIYSQEEIERCVDEVGRQTPGDLP